ncbi:hypothetical protein [Iamia sp.]|uniref:hypothetical protein n=1 Tax=Iamia sp. TaxID=2722710 RepID=UPI002C7AF570|nr:hypothetical protein [Iamia sp.]HXH55993.1 hypothetical protein [Iamia sp.]
MTDEPTLLEIGLHVGDAVRFRPRPQARWQEATVVRRERDGSVGLRDERGAARALPIERLEVRTRGRRGARTWEPLAQRADRPEQLDLFVDGAPPPAPASARRRPARRR